MPVIGKLFEFKVTNKVKSGYFLSKKNDSRSYFLENINVEEKINIGDTIEGRVIEKKRLKRGKISYQVSMKLIDDEMYETEKFNRKLERFLNESEARLSQIKKNKDRKIGRKKERRSY